MPLKLLFKYTIISAFIFIISFAGNWIIEKDSPPVQKTTLLPDGDDDKPAEEVYKNIQVLKGMPKKDLHMVMSFMKASLGVNCTFCHVHDEKNNTWNWESDDKEEKGTARKMITMVKGINKDYFEGFSAISCFSCHKGGTQVPRMPPLPQLPSNFTESERDTTIPAAEILIEKYTKSLGNIEKIKTAVSMYAKGTVTGVNGKAFEIEIYQQSPDKFLQTVIMPEGLSTKGYDGKNGWQKNQQGVTDLYDFQTAQVRDFAKFTADIDLAGRYTKVQVIGKDTVHGKDAYVVRASIDDNKSERLYFDTESGLLVRRKTFTKTIIGFIPEQAEYSDYKIVDGMMMPYTIHYSYVDPYLEAVRRYTEIKLNVPLDNINFSKP